MTQPKIILVTGMMAAGKSTLCQALAEALPRSVHLRGDTFRKMIVRGRVDMSEPPQPQALQQLQLRYHLAREAARLYLQADFTVVYQDVIIGPALAEVVRLYQQLPLHVVVLHADARVIAQREAQRHKTGYHHISIAQLEGVFAQTDKLGYWLDNSRLSIADSVRQVLDNLPQARISPGVEA